MIIKEYDCKRCHRPIQLLDDGTEWEGHLELGGAGIDWQEHNCYYSNCQINTKRFLNLINPIGEKFGNTIYDIETGKIYDIGQAICREHYGANWSDDPEHTKDNNAPDLPDGVLETAVNILRNGFGEWARQYNAQQD